MNSSIITNARIVTPDWVDFGSVVIENDIIADVARGKRYRVGEDIQGAWLAPGCIDIHSDYLEKEIHPRPSAEFSLPLAFHYMDQRAVSCGLTTVFSAISFSENEEHGRAFQRAIDRAQYFDTVKNESLARHYVHARLDPNSPTVVDHLQAIKAIESLQMVVYNDSIPGQRQFSLEDLVARRSESLNISLHEAREVLHRKIEERSRINHRPEIMRMFEGNVILGSHDDTTVEHVDEARMHGATLSEMPTTIEAARRAAELDMAVCMGAPNYVRGGSHCGNLSCSSAMDEYLVNVICSDYHFPSMLGSVIKMINTGMDPARAFDYVSLNPAKLILMDDCLGSIEVGKYADLVAFEPRQDFARVHKVWVGGRTVHLSPFPSTERSSASALASAQ